MADLGAVITASAVWGFLGSVFTRDIFFSVAIHHALWFLLFAPTYFAASPAIDVFFWIPIGVWAGAAVGIALVKMLNIGQLIDIWLTGSGGGDNSRNEERNVPFMLLAVVASFFLVFFIVSAVEGAGFLGGLLVLDQAVAIVVAIIFGLLLLGALVGQGAQIMEGERFHEMPDRESIGYFFGFVVIAGVPAVLYLTPGILNDYIQRGWLAAGVAVLLDLIVFGIGYAYESARDNWDDSRHGRWVSGGDAVPKRDRSAVWRIVLRWALVILYHAFFYVIGGYAFEDPAVAGDIVGVLNYPYLSLYMLIGIIVFLGSYIVIMVTVYLTRAKVRRPRVTRPHGGEEDASVEGEEAAETTPLVVAADRPDAAFTDFVTGGDDGGDRWTLPPRRDAASASSSSSFAAGSRSNATLSSSMLRSRSAAVRSAAAIERAEDAASRGIGGSLGSLDYM